LSKKCIENAYEIAQRYSKQIIILTAQQTNSISAGQENKKKGSRKKSNQPMVQVLINTISKQRKDRNFDYYYNFMQISPVISILK